MSKHILQIGSQVPDDAQTGSLFSSIKAVVKEGGNVCQVFLRNMCTTSVKGRKVIPPKEQKQILAYVKKHKLPVFVHASYLLNFCKMPVGLVRIKWAYELLRQDMAMAEKLGFKGVVLHMCSLKAVDEKWKPFMLSVKEAEQRMVDQIVYYFKEYGHEFPHVKLLLENSASEGSKIGGKMEQLGNVVRPLRKKYGTRIGVCLDTCHAFASGYAINTPKGVLNFFSDFKKHVGSYSIISLIHLNDSQTPLDSHKDRHAGLGKGFIFRGKEGHEALCTLVDFAVKHNIPMALETHADYKSEIKLVHKIYKTHKKGCQSGGKSKQVDRETKFLAQGTTSSRAVDIQDIIEILEEFEKSHKSLGNTREADQYRRAAASLRGSGMEKITSGKELLDLPWVGKGIAAKTDEYIVTGRVQLLEEFRKDPKIRAARELTKIFDVGPKTAQKFIRQGIYSVKDLRRAVDAGKVHLTKAQEIGLRYYDDLIVPIPRKETAYIRDIVAKRFKKVFKNMGETCTLLAGSYRLGKKQQGDIDLILAIKKLKTEDDVRKVPVLQNLAAALFEEGLLINTLQGTLVPRDNQVSYIGVFKLPSTDPKFRPHKARHIDLHAVGWDELHFHMLYFGSGETFSRAIRQWANDMGYRLSDRDLTNRKTKKAVPLKTEKEVFRFLGLEWVPPEKRRNPVLVPLNKNKSKRNKAKKEKKKTKKS
jgi:apurinic endonuclease APN1